jgi:crossover junction endodeoxyribonuclease RuvC
MRVVGFDPGLADTGYAAVESVSSRLVVVGSGVIRTSAALALEARLEILYEETTRTIGQFRPDLVVIEDVFSAPTVPRTAILVGYARAVICLAARRGGASITSVAPAEVKRAVTLSGAASKGQVARGVQALLGLAAPPRPSHVADALALAFTGLSRSRRPGGVAIAGPSARRASG